MCVKLNNKEKQVRLKKSDLLFFCVKIRKEDRLDVGEYEKGKLSLAIYGCVEDDENVSHISNATVNVEEKLEENEVVIDNYAKTNLISFLQDLGIVKSVPKKVTVKFLRLPVVELDLNKLYEYSYEQEVFLILKPTS